MLAKVFAYFVFMILLVYPTAQFGNWRPNRRPRIMGDRVPLRAILPTRRKIQNKIVLYHNAFRTRVEPKAANMLRMKYHKGAAMAAQRWSDKCMFLKHDNVTGRQTEHYGSCGQNIFVASQKVPWLFAIKTWYLEKDNFTYGSKKNNLLLVGHYTQMVWATTHEVGCGLSKCFRNGNFTGGTYYSYICNYCPAGNRQGQVGRPYRKGKPCGMCKRHCHARKLCTNSCKASDLWVNCKQLHRIWPDWLCNTSTPKGRERLHNCKATCTCKHRIHD